MRVCLIAEGCYPYVTGGVSGWIDSIIRSFPNMEFILLAVISDRKKSGKFAYKLPENLTEIHEVYLEDGEYSGSPEFGHGIRLNNKEKQALEKLMLDGLDNWDILVKAFNKRFSLDKFVMGTDFFDIATEVYDKEFDQLTFTDFIWTLRSMYLPLFRIMKTKMPKADVYHSVATGYSGILGVMGKIMHGGSLIISEHGIYTREREEEILKATWIQNIYKNQWLSQFRKMSDCAYRYADIVTSLFEHARVLQTEYGCNIDKTVVTPNGINPDRFVAIPGKLPEDEDKINIGAILRVTPIKDVKTMLQAYYFAKQTNPALKLWIMGPEDENHQYANECHDLVESFGIEDVVFTGAVDVTQYLGRMDMTILTSISEGQPLTILESFACKKPVIATDVGNCRGLIEGESDDFGQAGIVTHIMNVREISQAILTLAADKSLRESLGENGYNRVIAKYKISDMTGRYKKIYQDAAAIRGVDYPNDQRF